MFETRQSLRRGDHRLVFVVDDGRSARWPVVLFAFELALPARPASARLPAHVGRATSLRRPRRSLVGGAASTGAISPGTTGLPPDFGPTPPAACASALFADARQRFGAGLRRRMASGEFDVRLPKAAPWLLRRHGRWAAAGQLDRWAGFLPTLAVLLLRSSPCSSNANLARLRRSIGRKPWKVSGRCGRSSEDSAVGALTRRPKPLPPTRGSAAWRKFRPTTTVADQRLPCGLHCRVPRYGGPLGGVSNGCRGCCFRGDGRLSLSARNRSALRFPPAGTFLDTPAVGPM